MTITSEVKTKLNVDAFIICWEISATEWKKISSCFCTYQRCYSGSRKWEPWTSFVGCQAELASNIYSDDFGTPAWQVVGKGEQYGINISEFFGLIPRLLSFWIGLFLFLYGSADVQHSRTDVHMQEHLASSSYTDQFEFAVWCFIKRCIIFMWQTTKSVFSSVVYPNSFQFQ